MFSILLINACDSSQVLDIKQDGSSVEQPLKEEVASTQRDYVKTVSNSIPNNNNIIQTNINNN